MYRKWCEVQWKNIGKGRANVMKKIRSARLPSYIVMSSLMWLIVLEAHDCIVAAIGAVMLALYMTIVYVFPELRTITMDKDGCTVTWLKWKKKHKWEELAIIREDTWGRQREGFKGVVFSKSAVRKNEEAYTTEKIFRSLEYLDCFYVVFDNIKEDEFLKQLEEWGVKVEKGEELRKEQQYQEMVEIRKMARERRKNAIKKDGSRTNKKKG